MSLRYALFLIASLSVTANLFTLTDRYTADPAPFVQDGRVYIFTSHDYANQEGWAMFDYSLMSSFDLTNWRDEGIVFDIRNQTWGQYAWAQQVIDGPGGYYMYYPGENVRPSDPLKRTGTGVAFSKSLTGPYNDIIGAPLIACGDDPTVFRDDDGSVYLCGNCGGALCAKLDLNMTSFVSPPKLLSPALPFWFEAPWLSKWLGVYYLSYMCTRTADNANFSHFGFDICYGSCNPATTPSCSPLGPYTFRGSLMWSTPNDPTNNHQGIFEFPAGSGDLYFAYHSQTLSRENGEDKGNCSRNVGIERLYARSDSRTYPLPLNLSWVVDAPGEPISGFIPVAATPSWVRQLAYVDAFAPIAAADSARMSPGLNTETSSEGGRDLGTIAPGATTMIRGIDFGDGAVAVTLRFATPIAGVSITLFVDGTSISNCTVPVTGGWQIYTNITCALTSQPSGIARNLTLLFTGPPVLGLGNLLTLVFTRVAAVAVGLPPSPLSIPPPVAVRVALRSSATDLYWAVNGPGGLITPSGARGDEASTWILHDLEDGTWALEASSGGFACASGIAPIAASAAAAGSSCTRFWLYATPAGSHALLAINGLFVSATAAAVPLVATAADVRTAMNDGARHFFEEL
jgi:arabinoxylan arabinofuranohydrolase